MYPNSFIKHKSKNMKKRIAFIATIIALMLVNQPESMAQGKTPKPKTKLLPDTTVVLYPQGVPAEESNCITEPEYILENGNIGNITQPRMKIYLPKKPCGKMVVVCPGGGYKIVSSFNEGVYVAEWMKERGIAVCVVEYRLPNKHWEIPLNDIQAAFRYCRANASKWGVNQIGVMGFSAGGHLAASATTLYVDAETRPDFSILVYPVITMEWGVTHNGTRTQLIGADEDWTHNKRKLNQLKHYYSLENQVTEDTPKVFMIHCTDDKTVPVENSIRFYRALVENKVDCEYHIFPTGGHGWGFSAEKYVGKKKDKFSYGREEFYTSLERWLNSF